MCQETPSMCPHIQRRHHPSGVGLYTQCCHWKMNECRHTSIKNGSVLFLPKSKYEYMSISLQFSSADIHSQASPFNAQTYCP